MRSKRILMQGLLVSTVVAALATTRSSPAQTCPTQVTGHFGWTVPNPIITQVYWPAVRSDALLLAGNWINQLTDPNFYSPVQEYGINRGTLGGLYVPTGLPHGGTLSDPQIQDGLATTLQQQHTVPRSGEVYLIFLPSDSNAQMDNDPGAQGYHGFVTRQLWDGNSYLLVYGVIEYNGGDFQATNVAVSHELYEAFTDPIDIPTGNGHIQCTGYCDNGNNEIADICGGGFGGKWQGDYGMTLAQVWSQARCECFPFVPL
jgi:hypothetical protein